MICTRFEGFADRGGARADGDCGSLSVRVFEKSCISNDPLVCFNDDFFLAGNDDRMDDLLCQLATLPMLRCWISMSPASDKLLLRSPLA